MTTSEPSTHHPRGFRALLVAQFLGAANDNLLKGVLTFMVIDGIWRDELGPGGQSLVALCFTVPFIVLSGWAGQFTQRRGKREVAILLKTIEIPIAGLALYGTVTRNLWLTLAALLILSSQSAYFGPAKYGMIPDLMGGRRLARANGVMNLLTNVAAIIATVLAGLVADAYAPKAEPLAGTAWLPGACFLGLALVGFVAIRGLPRTIPAGDPGQRYDWNPLTIYIQTLRAMAKSPLLRVTLAWGYFYLLAGLVLLVVPEYTVVLDISREMAGRVLGVLAISLGVGSYVAGLVARPGRTSTMVIAGGLGLSAAFVALGLVPPTYGNVVAFIFFGGFLAGFYVIPLQALIQSLSPADQRGRMLGTANGVSFMFMSLASVLYWLVRPAFGDQPQRVFVAGAVLMLLGLWLFFGPAGGLGLAGARSSEGPESDSA